MYPYKFDSNIDLNDGISQCCRCERVNEDHMRAMMKEEGLNYFNKRNLLISQKQPAISHLGRVLLETVFQTCRAVMLALSGQ